MSKEAKKRRTKHDCKFFKPRGRTTNYCTINEKDPLKRCYGVCNHFLSIKNSTHE